MSDNEMDIEAVELDQIYAAMSILGIDKESTNAYLFLLKEGASPIERIPISPHKKMRILQLLVAKKLVTASRGGQYTARDAELVLRASVDEHQRNARLLEKAISELELSGRSSKTRSLNTSDEFYQWEAKLIQRTITGIYGLTVRFKLMWLMKDVLKERIETSHIDCRVLGDVHTSETLQRAIDLEDAGVEVRHSPAVGEMLRFILFDNNSVVFGFRNPTDANKHLGAWIRSEAFVEPLKLQFDAVWKKADTSDKWKKFKFDD